MDNYGMAKQATTGYLSASNSPPVEQRPADVLCERFQSGIAQLFSLANRLEIVNNRWTGHTPQAVGDGKKELTPSNLMAKLEDQANLLASAIDYFERELQRIERI